MVSSTPTSAGIIYLHPHFTSAGGAGRMVLETGRRLASRGHDVHCVCIRADDKIVGGYDGIKFHEIGGPLSSSILFWLQFRSTCRRVTDRIDEVVSQSSLPKWVLFPQVFPANWWGGVLRATRPELDCVWYCHEPSAFIHSSDWIAALPWPKNWFAKLLNPYLKWMDLKYCRRFRTILVNSEFSRTYTQRIYGFSDQSCKVAYLGVDLAKFRPGSHEARQPWIACVAKLTRFKNVHCIVDAIDRLTDCDLSRSVQLHIIGTGDAEQELRRQVDRLGLERRVIFHGRLSDADMAPLIESCSGLCLASVDEPFGLVAIEAMACGTPIIAVNSGGPAEIVGESDAGILVEYPEPQLIAAAIKELLEYPERYAVRSRAARVRAEDFDWEKTVDRLESAFGIGRSQA